MPTCLPLDAFLSLQVKLAELYRSSAEEAEGKVRELMAGVERLQSLVEDATREREQLGVQLAEEGGRSVCLSVC